MRFGRKRAADEPVEETDESFEEPAGIADLPAVGPFDESQVDLDDHKGLDLGSLIVTPADRMDVQLQVDEASGEVGAVLLVSDDGMLELRAFAASRGGGAWAELIPQIASEVTRMGGTATEQQGRFGAELVCIMPVQTPDGQGGTQPSRVIGHEGATWLLRATLVGRPAVEDDVAAEWEETIRRVVVRRGREARAPGSPLPLRLPPDLRTAD